MRPLTHELMHVWITADGKKFLDKDKAESHYRYLKRREQRERIKQKSRRKG